MQVVRAFDDSNVHHVSGSLDPKRDIEIINLELIFADIDTIDRRIGDNQKKVRAGEKDAKAREEIYTKVKNQLESGKIVSLMEMTDEEKLMIADLHLLTNKPFIYAVNVSEEWFQGHPVKGGSRSETETGGFVLEFPELRDMTGIIDPQIPVLPVSAKIEMDMLEFSDEDKKMFLADMGVEFNPMDAIIRKCYDLLGLQYYFTAGEIEVRAWTIHRGDTAPEAAGVIHTDFQKKFIKAETVNYKDIIEFGGWAGAREKGKVKMEGKEYIVQDGDVMLFKFGA